MCVCVCVCVYVQWTCCRLVSIGAVLAISVSVSSFELGSVDLEGLVLLTSSIPYSFYTISKYTS